MRIWDIDPSLLCRQHLLGEHRELHGLWNILRLGKKGYSRHPETLRWVGKLHALRLRHEALVAEMTRRGWNHNSPLPEVSVDEPQTEFVDNIDRQFTLIRGKGCDCLVPK